MTIVDRDRAVVWDQVRAVQDGDNTAFAGIYQRYAGAVYAYVRRLTSNADLAEDITSETFLRALRGIDFVADQGKDLQAWLFTIARNIVNDQAKTRWIRSTVMRADVEPQAAADPGPEDEVIARSTSAEIADYLQRLTREQRQCLTLRFFQSMSVKETAEAMQRTEAAVKGLQYRAVRGMAEMVANDEVVAFPSRARAGSGGGRQARRW